jgi:hypothetical protein
MLRKAWLHILLNTYHSFNYTTPRVCSIIIIKYINSSNTSTTFYKVSTGYMFQLYWAIIRPYIWTGSFNFSAFCKRLSMCWTNVYILWHHSTLCLHPEVQTRICITMNKLNLICDDVRFLLNMYVAERVTCRNMEYRKRQKYLCQFNRYK